MTKITLLRHAIAIDKVLGQDDFSRELTSIGREKCLKYLEKHYASLQDIDIIICSGAMRTRQTCGLLCSMINCDPNWIIYDDRVYTIDHSYDTLLAILQEAPKDKKHICLVGHNDSISALASYLTKENINLKKGHLIQTTL